MKTRKAKILAVLLLLGMFVPGPSHGQDAPKVVRKAGGVLIQSATKRVTATYPEEAKAARRGGNTVVEVIIDVDGKVESARLVSGDGEFEAASLEAARAWTFKPSSISGEAVKVIGTITFNFMPDPDPEVLKQIESYKEELRSKANRTGEQTAEIYRRLGEAFDKINNPVDAVAAYKQSLNYDPRLIPVRVGLARIYIRMRDKASALAEINRLKELDPVLAEELTKELDK